MGMESTASLSGWFTFCTIIYYFQMLVTLSVLSFWVEFSKHGKRF